MPRLEQIERYNLNNKERVSYPHSPDMAWMISLLAWGGNVVPSGTISFSTYETGLTKAFKEGAEFLFDKNVSVKTTREKPDGSTYQNASLFSRSAAQFLGDLRRKKWPETIRERHSWIFEKQDYAWRFIEAANETRGLNQSQGILFATSYPNVAHFLKQVLTLVGVENSKLRYKNPGTEKEELFGVGVYNIRDLKHIASNIHSFIPKKESVLEEYRQREEKRKQKQASATDGREKKLKKGLSRMGNRRKISIERRTERRVERQELILDEWKGLTKLLGHIPTSKDIARLKREKHTKYSVATYTYNFGQREDGTYSFVAASQNIQAIIAPGEEQQTKDKKIRSRGGWKPVESPDQLINEYITARAICLQEKGRLPTIHDIDELLQKEVVQYTAHTLANYFGERSFIRARQILEGLVKEKVDNNVVVTRQLNEQPQKRNREATTDDKIQEWIRIKKILGHTPSYREILDLKKARETKYSPSVYRRGFGEGNFVKARENLERIVAEREAHAQEALRGQARVKIEQDVGEIMQFRAARETERQSQISRQLQFEGPGWEVSPEKQVFP